MTEGQALSAATVQVDPAAADLRAATRFARGQRIWFTAIFIFLASLGAIWVGYVIAGSTGEVIAYFAFIGVIQT